MEAWELALAVAGSFAAGYRGLLAAGLVGAVPGGWLGARATGRFDEERLRLLLGAVLVLVAAVVAAQAPR